MHIFAASIFRKLVQAIMLVLAFGLASAQQIHPASSRLQSLEVALAAGNVNALPQFWDDVKRIGSPLIEPIQNRPGFVLVTFLWHGSPATRSVSLLSGPQFLSHYKNEFSRLAGTDLWCLAIEMPEGVRIGYQLSETSASPSSSGSEVEKQSSGSDPLNLRRSEYDPTQPPSGAEPFSIFETSNVAPEPWLRRHPGIQTGTIETLEVPSRILGTKRKVQICRPRFKDTDNEPVGSVYLFDGDSYLDDMHIADVLDNLVGERKIKPLIAILISSLPGEDRDGELQCDPKFTEFVSSELVPWVQAHYPVSHDPRKTIIGGFSLGALEAAFVARSHPERFGAVLAQSPSLWWQPKSVVLEESVPWIAQEYIKSGKPKTRIFISVGRDEPTIIEKARAFERLLRSQGYELRLEEVEGQHDPINWRLTLPNGLLFLGEAQTSP